MTNTAAVLVLRTAKALRILLHSHVCGDKHGWWNRSSRPGNCQTNVCCMVPEKQMWSLHVDNQLLARRVSLIVGLKQTMEFLCIKQTGPLLASFVLSHSFRPQRRLLYCR